MLIFPFYKVWDNDILLIKNQFNFPTRNTINIYCLHQQTVYMDTFLSYPGSNLIRVLHTLIFYDTTVYDTEKIQSL